MKVKIFSLDWKYPKSAELAMNDLLLHAKVHHVLQTQSTAQSTVMNDRFIDDTACVTITIFYEEVIPVSPI